MARSKFKKITMRQSIIWIPKRLKKSYGKTLVQANSTTIKRGDSRHFTTLGFNSEMTGWFIKPECALSNELALDSFVANF
jgi:hypothetical protein